MARAAFPPLMAPLFDSFAIVPAFDTLAPPAPPTAEELFVPHCRQ
jgi:hypothetical protein